MPSITKDTARQLGLASLMLMAGAFAFIFLMASMQNHIAAAASKSMTHMEERIDDMRLEFVRKIDKIMAAEKGVATVTCYTASRDECDSTPDIGAINRKVIPGRTVAVSRDYTKYLGKKIYIEGIGERVVEDLMNARYKNRVDVLVITKSEAYKFGVQKRMIAFYD